MSHYSTPFCSDEELLKELNKLGYDEIPPDVFERMKHDLSELVSKEKDDLSSIVENEHDPLSEYGYNDETQQSSKYISTTSDALGGQNTVKESYKKAVSHASRKTKRKTQKPSLRYLNDNEILGPESSRFQNTNNETEIKNSHSLLEYSNINDEDILSEFGNSEKKYDKKNKLKSNDIYASRNSKIDHNTTDEDRYCNSSKRISSGENSLELDYFSKNDELGSAKIRSKAGKESKPTKSWEKIQEVSDTQNTANDNTLKSVNDAFKAFNLDESYSDANESVLNNHKYSDINLNTSSAISSEKKTIKRKVLRRRNGKSVITEELVEIPSIFDTSYPESENLNSSKSFSSDDLSYKSNGSTGSVTVLSPEASIKSSPSTFSLSSRSTSLRISNTRKKKSDPVAMYNYYKKFWDSFKPPGENTRDRLRWAVRDKMLEYHI